MASDTLADLSEFTTDDLPDGWSPDPDAADTVDMTAAFRHESGEWLMLVQRHGPGITNGTPSCDPLIEDGLEYVAPLFETRLACLDDDVEAAIRVDGDLIPLEGFESHVFADPDGTYLQGNLRQMEADRKDILERPPLREALEEAMEDDDGE